MFGTSILLASQMIAILPKLFHTFSRLLLLLIAATAPWFAGGYPGVELFGWYFSASLLAAFLFTALACLIQRQPLRVSRPVVVIVVALLACLAVWSFRPELSFASDFTRRHIAMLRTTLVPGGFIIMPRNLHLAWLGAMLLGLVAAAHQGCHPSFRKHLILVIGWSGLAVAGYSLCQNFLGWKHPSWVWSGISNERLTASFFHYSLTAACLNLAWPLLVFRSSPVSGRKIFFWVGAVTALVVAAFAHPLWPAAAAQAVAVGVLLLGMALALNDRRHFVPTLVIPWLIALAFIALLAIQAYLTHKMSRQFPDGWTSAEVSLFEAPERGKELDELTMRRGDRFIPGPAPARESGWLASWRMSLDHPIFGQGPGSLVARQALYTNSGLINSFFLHLQFSHHDLLQTAAEWGLVPLVGWLVLWALAMRRLADGGATSRAILLALVGVAAHSLVDFPLQTPALQMWTALLLGLALTLPGRRQPTSRPASANR